jgi:hypothetical protein
VISSSSEAEESETLWRSSILDAQGAAKASAGGEGVLPPLPAGFSTSGLDFTGSVGALVGVPAMLPGFSLATGLVFFFGALTVGARPLPLAAAAALLTALGLSFAVPRVGLPLLPPAAGLSTTLTLREFGAPAPGAGEAREEGGAPIASPLACRGACWRVL